MKKNKELWRCWRESHGEFETKADQPKCPICKTISCYFIRELDAQDQRGEGK
ncbi:hypothetical protein LCGC14_0465720 [marine sediment metagenome]|uniref:Uncharacterized protein n=1 Tax=marine sediment metagenome TaxID=412755 RepID=A0A0F9VMJ7_9ZZZZ